MNNIITTLFNTIIFFYEIYYMSKVLFKELPISKRKLKGSLETLGQIDYHYQKYDNTFKFFDKIMEKDKKIKKVLCIPEAGDSWMRSFLRVVLDSDKIDTSELMVKNVSPVDPLVSVEKFNKMVRKCNKRFIAISVQLIVKGKPGTHANILIIDTKKYDYIAILANVEGNITKGKNIIRKEGDKILIN